MNNPKEKKKPIPLTISGVAYITTSGIIRYCTAGHDSDGNPISRPKDFKEWCKPTKVDPSRKEKFIG